MRKGSGKGNKKATKLRRKESREEGSRKTERVLGVAAEGKGRWDDGTTCMGKG